MRRLGPHQNMMLLPSSLVPLPPEEDCGRSTCDLCEGSGPAPKYNAPSKLARFLFKRVAWISPNVRAWTNTAHNLDI